MQILSDFAHLEFEAIDRCCPEEGGDTQNFIYDLSLPHLGQAPNAFHQDWLKDRIKLLSVSTPY